MAPEPGTDELRARLASLSAECGCRMGGIFLGVALAAAVLYFLTIGTLDLASGLQAGALVFGASVTGKLFALGVARLRMARLRRLLAARLATTEVRHVHVH
jgi:hypothetical protein